MKKLSFSFYSFAIVPVLMSVVLMSSKQSETNSTYSPITLVSNYPTSINEWTNQDKIEAFEYVSLTGDCSFKGIKLQGKVKFVTSFPDIKIQYVTSFPDIKVKFVTSFPDACGKWQVVESFPDFTLQIVTSFPDLKVQQVESFPGMN